MNVVHVVNNDRVSNLSIGSNGIGGSSLTVSFDEDFADQPRAVCSLFPLRCSARLEELCKWLVVTNVVNCRGTWSARSLVRRT